MAKKPPPKSKRPPPRPARFNHLKWVGMLVAGLTMLVVIQIANPDMLPLSFLGGSSSPQAVTDPDAELASFYAPSVLYWQEDIKRWAQQYQLNPNVIAIIMQIESCGDPIAVSSAGALGLFQVMPFNFQNGDNMLNPDTNVQRGMAHLKSCLNFADWDVGRALACYNAGFVSPSQWVAETQSYYKWGSGLWQDVMRGGQTSPTLQEWLTRGQALCDRASRHVQRSTAEAGGGPIPPD